MADKTDFDRLGDLLPAGGDGTGESTARLPAPVIGGPTIDGRSPSGAAAGAAASADLNRRLAALWPKAVGAEIAANARPAQLRAGRLVVTTSSSAWAQTLHSMSEMVVARLNEQLGANTIERAVFRHAGWEEFPVVPPACVPVVPPACEPASQGEASPRPPRRRQSPAPRRPRGTPAGPPGSPADLPTASVGADLAGLSDEERRALADLEALPLAPAVKETIREAMMAGFVRARQDLGR